MESPKVFISYSHDTPEHVELVLNFSDRLRQDGIDCILDQYETAPAEGWTRWMDKHIRDSDFVIMVCTHPYYRRVMGEEKPGKGQGVRWEGNLIYQHIYNADTTNTRFIPVLLESGKFEHIPTPLQSATYHRVDTEKGYEYLYRRLTNQLRIEKPKLGKLKTLPRRSPVAASSTADEPVMIELPETKVGKDGAEMVLIPAGNFQMGSDDGEDDEKPVHTVYADAFYMDKYEVTNAQYRRFVQATKYSEPTGYGYVDGEWRGGFRPWSDNRFSGDDQPVVCVSWADAQAYAEWAGKRLPTEAEWEKAARGGLIGMEYPCGNEIAEENANYGDNIGNATPVDSYPPNSYGLYDMAGNVWEWCADWYDENYYANSVSLNPIGPDSGTVRVLRGGSWYYNPFALRVAFRFNFNPSLTYSLVGFRCVSQD